jgi:hypothetical protein
MGGDATIALFGDGNGEGDELFGLGVEGSVDEHGAAQRGVTLEHGRDLVPQGARRLAEVVEDVLMGQWALLLVSGRWALAEGQFAE